MTTPLEVAQEELAAAHAPDPRWMEEDLSPHAVLLYCWEQAKVALEVATAAATSLGGPADEEQPVVNEVLNGVSAALAGYTVSLCALEVLPPAALDALKAGPRGR